VAAALAAQFAGGLVPSAIAGEIAGLPAVARDIALYPFVADSRDVDPVLLREALRGNSHRSLLAVWRAARRADVPRLMEANTTPTDLLWGADDRLITTDDVTRAQRLLKADRVQCLRHCGHWPLLERPAETAEFILSADVR
jgi:pimeloyl-ACP methyl ester carboxylesterase